VDTIVQSASISDATDLTFTVARSDLLKAMSIVEPSEIRITCIIAEDRVKDAVRALHRAFQLEKET